MQDGYILDIPSDLDSLEQDMNDWLLLPYDLQKQGNDNCIAKYGVTNQQLFNILKARLLNLRVDSSNQHLTLEQYIGRLNKKYLQEISKINLPDDNTIMTSNVPATGITPDGTINTTLEKIEAGDRVSEDDNIVVINDFLNPDNPDYGLDVLNSKYNKYLNSTTKYKIISNEYSMKIWGMTVPQMYNHIKSILDDKKEQNQNKEKVKDIKDFVPDRTDQQVNNYISTIESESSDDIMNSLIRKLDCTRNSNNRTLYESAILENFGDTIKIGNHSYRQDMPGVMPFLYYYEYLHNTNSLDEKKIQARNPFTYVMNAFSSKTSVREAYTKGDTNALIEMGWNPYVKPTDEAFEYAREKQINYLDEYFNFNIYDVSRFYTNESIESLTEVTNSSNKILQPVFLIVNFKDTDNKLAKKFKKLYDYKDFSNIGISFDSELKHIFAYTDVGKDRINRMEDLSIKDYLIQSSVQIMCFFVSSSIKKRMKQGINNYMVNQDNSNYNFDTLTTLLNDTPSQKSLNLYLLIAEFLDSIFKISNIYDKTGSVSDTSNSDKNRKIYIMYNGKAGEYKSNKVEKNVKWIQKNIDYSEANFFTTEIDDNNIEYYNFDTYIKDWQNASPVTYETALKIRECLTPTAFITEDFLCDIENEGEAEDIFKDCHQLLYSYNETETDAIKKQLSRLCFLHTILVEALKKLEKDNPAYNKLLVIKNSTEADIKFFESVVKSSEPEFNIKDYIKGEPEKKANFTILSKGIQFFTYSGANFKM